MGGKQTLRERLLVAQIGSTHGVLVRTSLALCSVLVVGACTANRDPHAPIMDKIEQQVVLPHGAAPLSRYSRYYAEVDSGRIQAAFVIHDDDYREEVRKFCAAKGANIFPCSKDGNSELPAPGKRKWLQNAAEMPIPDGGGCGAVTFQYDPASGKFSPPECNGPY